jgi:hypothetical protein
LPLLSEEETGTITAEVETEVAIEATATNTDAVVDPNHDNGTVGPKYSSFTFSL